MSKLEAQTKMYLVSPTEADNGPYNLMAKPSTVQAAINAASLKGKVIVPLDVVNNKGEQQTMRFNIDRIEVFWAAP